MSATGTAEILLVEDEAIIALGTKQLLEKRGFAVTVSHSAVDAVTAADSHSFDLVLMDIDLGPRKADGTEAAAQILRNRHLPIVFLTSHSEKEMVERVRGITRYGYVLKNSGEFVLLQAIETALDLFRAHRALEETATRWRESEERYELVVRHSEEAITLFDTDGRVLLINEKAAVNLGGKPADFTGKRLSDFLPAEDADRAMAGLKLAMESRESSVTEWEVPLPEGSRWFRSRIHPVLDNDGKVLSVLSSSLDTTEQVNAAKAVSEAERRARIVADSVPALVYVHDFRARRNSWANRAHREFFRAAGAEGIEEAEQARVLSVIHPEDHEALFEQLRRATEAHYDPREAITLRCWNGHDWDWFLHRHALLDTGEGGEPYSVLGVLTPINELKKKESEATAEVERRDLLWEEINHRIKNNLALVSSLLSLQEQATGVDLSGARRQIEAIGQVHHLLSDEAARGAVDLSHYAEAVVDSLRGYSDAVPVDLEAPEIAITPRDAVMVGLILNELVTNALQHGQEHAAHLGAPPVANPATDSKSPARVEVRITGTAEELTVAVSNDGPRLPDSFDPQSDAGMGLKLIHALAAQGGGSLEVRREPRTEFAVTLSLSGLEV